MEETQPHRDEPPATGQAPRRLKRSWLGHALSWLGHSLTGTVAAALLIFPLAVGLLIARLVAGPLSLGPLKDELLAAMDRSLIGYAISVDDIRLIWGGWDDPLQLRLLGAVVRPDDSTAEIRLPDTALRFDLISALSGVIAPTQLAFYGPHLGLTLRADGSVDIGLLADGAQAGAQALAGSDDLIGGILTALQGAPGSPMSGNKLTRVVIVQAAVDVDDQRHRAQWGARDLYLTLQRDPLGLRANMKFTAPLPDNRVVVEANARYAADGLITADLTVNNLNPMAAAKLSPDFAGAGALDMALSGGVRLVLDPNMTVREAGFRLTGHDGVLTLPERFPEPLLVRSLVFSALTSDPAHQFELDVLAIDLDGPAVVLRGEASRQVGQPWQADLIGDARGVPVGALSLFWPLGLGAPARDWVTNNLEDGMAPYAEIRTSLLIDPNGSTQIQALSGFIDFEGVTTHYLRPLPPLRGTVGRATFGPTRFDIDITAGRQGDLQAGPARIEITQLDTDSEQFAAEVNLTGPIRQALDLLDRKPLDLLGGLGIKPAQTAGDATAKVKLSFPLLKHLRLSDVVVSAEASLRNLSLTGLLPGKGLEGGTLSLKADTAGLTAEGQIELAGELAQVRWQEVFDRKADPGRTLHLTTTLTPTGRRTLGIDLAPWLQGPLPVVLDYNRSPNGVARVAVDADLTAADLAMAKLGWHKPAGLPAKAAGLLELAGERLRAIPVFSLTAGADKMGGAVRFATDGAFDQARLTDVVIGETNLASLSIRRTSPQTYDVGLSGSALDARPLLKDDDTQSSATPPERGPRVNVELALGAVQLSDKMQFAGVSGHLRHDGLRTALADLTLRTAENTAATVQISPHSEGRRLQIRTDDAGALLRAIGASSNLESGQLLLQGRYDDTQRRPPMAGSLRIDNFRLKQAPLLARLLKAATFGGLGDLLQGQGLSFSRLESGLTVAGDGVRIDGLRATGGSLGITASGTLNLKTDTVDIGGNLVPVLLVNQLLEGTLGRIPLLGDVLTGRNDGGMFAVSYSVKGALADAQISVNPLSALTPGILRELFFDSTPVK